MVQPFWKTVPPFLIKLNIPVYLSQDLVILIGIYQREKEHTHTKTCTYIHNNLTLEIIQISINRNTDKQIVIYYNEMSIQE